MASESNNDSEVDLQKQIQKTKQTKTVCNHKHSQPLTQQGTCTWGGGSHTRWGYWCYRWRLITSRCITWWRISFFQTYIQLIKKNLKHCIEKRKIDIFSFNFLLYPLFFSPFQFLFLFHLPNSFVFISFPSTKHNM